MPICRPEFPNFKSKGEERVWKMLVDTLPKNATIFQNQKLSLYGRSLEIDTFVVLPGHGMVCIEVKGGQVEVLADGNVKTYYQGRSEIVNPQDQCDDYISALKNAVKNDPELTNPRIAWLAIFPDTELPIGTQKRTRYMDKSDLHNLRDEIIRVAKETDSNGKTNGPYARRFISEIFGEDLGIKGWIDEQPSRDSFRLQKILDRSEILEMTDARQFRFQGPPGCGKTQLALLQARRLTIAGNEIALICYSEAVARYFQREVALWPSNEKPKYVGTFHGLSEIWNIKTPELNGKLERDSWYATDASNAMLRKLQQSSGLKRFDGFVVDEGQDFKDEWWNVITSAFKNNHESNYLCVFGDKNEDLFQRNYLTSLALFELKINRTIRQSAPIAEFYRKVTGADSKVTGLGGPSVRVIPTEPELAMLRANMEIDKLLADGWAPGDILVINTGHTTKSQMDLFNEVSKDKSAFWDRFFEKEKTFYCHVYSAKGIESPVVVVVFDGWQAEDKKQQLTNAAISRATDKLVIVGDCSTVEKAKLLWEKSEIETYDNHTLHKSKDFSSASD
jgi:hypothetical protein